MEAKAVTSGMTAMPRRSREHRSTKNVETIQEASDSQLDIASTSKNSKAGILSSSDALLHRKDLGDSSNLRRSSRVCRSSQMSKVAFSSKTLEARANGAKVLMHGVSDISPASSSGKTPAVIGVASEVLKLWVNVEAGQGASSLVQPSHVANSNETSTPLGSGCTSDAAGQPNGRPLRGRPRGRHVTPAKKIARRAKRLQEVPLSESDGPRILGRRIKIFWRDENRWFYGVVKAYNRGRRSHKIVYDDKEEEWVKLHEEIFKLQVLEGEVFGEQQQAAAAAAQPAQVASIFAKNVSSIEKGRNMNHQEFSSGEIAGSANGGIQASALTNSTHVPPSLLQGSESSLELPGVRFDGEFRDQGSSIRDDAFNTRAIQESEDALPMVCENVDPEDPYAIDHTSISDSLVMFMRSKQNLAESRKVPATSGVMPPSQPAAVGASSIEACEPMLVERAALSVVRPVLEDLDRGGERSHQEGFIEINDGSFPRNDEVVAFESHPAAPRTYCAENDARDTIVGVEAGSAGGLTEVQIGIAVDGEEDSTIACWRSWASVKRGFSQITPDEMRSYGLGTVSRLLDSELGSIALTKRQKVHVESLSSTDFENGNDDGTKNTLLVGCETNGDMNIRSVETKDSDSVLPRVNVLKLRKCSTGKGGWRIAGNSCVADRTVRQSGDGGEPMTPSSTADRKRPFSQCSEFNQLESPEENGHPGPFIKGSHTNGQDTFHADGANEVKVPVKGMWSNCEVSSINDASFNSRKRFKNGSTNSGSSDDSYAPHFRAEETCRSRNSTEHVYPDSVCHGCIANVLVVQNDRGWREYGASIELQSCHGQGWMLIISVRGENMYAYKAEQAIVTGTTNRHNHAIVWKGGKGWNLEFEDKKQWQVFKELHEECYRRNSKASSGRQIPIPGVRHIEDIAPRSPGCHFMRPNSRYICRVEDEVEMALGNSRVMYDMDSEDEQWLEQINTERANARGTLARPLIAEETLERLLDKLEKEAYLYQQEHKDMNLDPSDVAAESCNGLATQEVIKVIYSYWLDKRTRKGTPLVRQFQPPAWVLYQKQLQQWEQEIARLQLQHPSASMQQLTEDKKKPPLFAFCLRPRGLEAQHKLSKQKSHRKQALPGTAPRQWVGFGSMDGSLHSPRGRQYYTEPAHGLLPAPRRPGRPRLTEEVGANLNGSFNAIMREPATLSGAMSSMQLRNEAFNEYAHRRAGKNKKVGRKARRQRLLAAAQESRRKRLLMRSVGSGELHRQPDLALAAARARSTAEAARARAQALYAVADAAMHKAVAAVIAADALHAAELHENTEEEELPSKNRNLAVVPTYGSWRRAVPGSVLGGLGAKGIVNRQVLESDGEDALLPVASWSQELGAGLGTRLLNKDARVEDIISTRSVHARSPSINVGLGRTRGESTVAMLTR
uniref:Enhancer of polycomb-like protein n=1 Tax=Physcomitrium patens TaxID=3218 RepID=A0A7I4E4R4_PHYPA